MSQATTSGIFTNETITSSTPIGRYNRARTGMTLAIARSIAGDNIITDRQTGIAVAKSHTITIEGNGTITIDAGQPNAIATCDRTINIDARDTIFIATGSNSTPTIRDGQANIATGESYDSAIDETTINSDRAIAIGEKTIMTVRSQNIASEIKGKEDQIKGNDLTIQFADSGNAIIIGITSDIPTTIMFNCADGTTSGCASTDETREEIAPIEAIKYTRFPSKDLDITPQDTF